MFKMKIFWENVETMQRSPLGSLECLKYNRVDFCLNSQSNPHLVTEMND